VSSGHGRQEQLTNQKEKKKNKINKKASIFMHDWPRSIGRHTVHGIQTVHSNRLNNL
jgi:hypothetical protein